MEHDLSRSLLEAVKKWQGGLKSLQKGEQHPEEGSCSTAVAAVLLAQTVTHCSARPNKLKTHVSVDLRVALYSELMPFTPPAGCCPGHLRL